jgi:RNA polymerase subunit RPABC4/transcription elongation factor Spt4
MALTTCRECKGQISEWATKCPHCGAPDPVKSQWIMTVVVWTFIVIVFGAVLIKMIFFK